jgi:membrane protein
MPEQQPSRDAGRGREAESPQQIPVRGWLDVVKRAWTQSQDNNTSVVAGGVTYAVLVALFPGLAALVSIYGLVFDRSQLEQQMAAVTGLLPEQSRALIAAQLHQLVTAPNSALGIGLVVSVLIALWSASRGMASLIAALNIAYEQKETRGFFKLLLIALGLTLAMIIAGIVAIVLVAALPVAVKAAGVSFFAKWLALILEWPLLAVLLLFGLAALYRYGPDRREAKWRWVSPGAIFAMVTWIVGSILFSAYVSHFNSYNATYGSLGAVVVLLTWLYLTAYVVMFGAEINAQAERQTRRDSTGGSPRPMGQREAWAADTLGETR